MRTIIDIAPERVSELDAWAQAQNISRAEAVRRAVDLLIERVSKPKGLGFGIWTNQSHKAIPPERDGLRLQQALRDEWPE